MHTDTNSEVKVSWKFSSFCCNRQHSNSGTDDQPSLVPRNMQAARKARLRESAATVLIGALKRTNSQNPRLGTWGRIPDWLDPTHGEKHQQHTYSIKRSPFLSVPCYLPMYKAPGN